MKKKEELKLQMKQKIDLLAEADAPHRPLYTPVVATPKIRVIYYILWLQFDHSNWFSCFFISFWISEHYLIIYKNKKSEGWDVLLWKWFKTEWMRIIDLQYIVHNNIVLTATCCFSDIRDGISCCCCCSIKPWQRCIFAGSDRTGAGSYHIIYWS